MVGAATDISAACCTVHLPAPVTPRLEKQLCELHQEFAEPESSKFPDRHFTILLVTIPLQKFLPCLKPWSCFRCLYCAIQAVQICLRMLEASSLLKLIGLHKITLDRAGDARDCIVPGSDCEHG